MLEELDKQSIFINLIEHCEYAHIVFLFRFVLKVLYIITNNSPVCDQEPPSIQYIRYHHYLVKSRIRELQRCFGCLNVKCHDSQISFV